MKVALLAAIASCCFEVVSALAVEFKTANEPFCVYIKPNFVNRAVVDISYTVTGTNEKNVLFTVN